MCVVDIVVRPGMPVRQLNLYDVRTLVPVYCTEKSFQAILGAQMPLIARFKGIDVADSSVWSMLVCSRSDARVSRRTQNHVAYVCSIEYRHFNY